MTTTKPDKYVPKRVRVTMNQVSGELERTVLDPVQIAYERTLGVFEGQAIEHKLTVQEIPRYAEKVALAVLRFLGPYTDSQNTATGLRDKLIMALADKLATCSAELARCAEEGK